jgi:exonuclease VII small subunit
MFRREMFRKGTSFPSIFLVIFGFATLSTSRGALAQYGGGGGGGGGVGGGRGGTSGAGRPSGVDEKDDLRGFHRALALQATARQSALFTSAVQDAEAASAQLHAFRDTLQKAPASDSPEHAATLHDSIELVRRSNQSFLASFSGAQKSALKDITKKLAKEDADLARQLQAFDQGVQSAKPAGELLASAANLDKVLTSFEEQQLAIGREMSIVIAPAGEQLSFNLPAMPNSLTIAGQSMSLPASGVVERTSAANGHNLFRVTLNADLYDLQQNLTGVLRSALNRSPDCGERIEIKQARLAPAAPSTVVTAQLHFERWICPLGRSGNSTEAAAGEGTIEVKLTPTIKQNAGLGLDSEIIRVEAEGFLRNMLRSGDLGESLRQQISTAILEALRQATNLKSALPSMAQESVSLQKAQFQNAGSDKLGFNLEGELQLSEEQTKLFSEKLKQVPSFKETSAR